MTAADRPVGTARVVVAIDGTVGSLRLIETGRGLAERVGGSWEVLHIEIPGSSARTINRTADVLALAAQQGAVIASVPAADVVTGVLFHLETMPADYVVVGSSGRNRLRLSVAERLARSNAAGAIVVVPCGREEGSDRSVTHGGLLNGPPARAYIVAAVLVAATLVLALLLQRVVGARVLDMLFLLPVMTVAARYGLVSSVIATALSVAAYNFFLLPPLYTLGFKSPLTVIMTIALLLVGGYTTLLTARLRQRAVLSDRSAHQNASIAAFGQSLANAADWETTAAVVCEEVTGLLSVRAAVLREKDGKLVIAAALPADPQFGPVDHAALDWAWENGLAAGSGTEMLGAADWQFQPLSTSLGRLAILAIARDTGRNPVRADQAVLLATLVAQASLAHERLRLEDDIRANRDETDRG